MPAQASSPSESSTEQEPDPHGFREEGLDLMRGIAAGSLVGMPLLYTMEMWCQGMLISPRHQLIFLAVMLVMNTCTSYFAGFRDEYNFHQAISESIASVALGLLLSCGVLCLINEITFSMSAGEIVGKVLIAAGPVSLGVTFANIHVRNKSRTGDDEDEDESEDKGKDKEDASEEPRGGERRKPSKERASDKPEDLEALQRKADLKDIGATLGGTLLFSYNVAPTEEVVQIAARIPAWQHLFVMGASLLLCYVIIYASGFGDGKVYVSSVFQHPMIECLMAYAISLLVSLVLLALVGMPEVMSSPAFTMKAVVTLSLVGVVGGAAGRLAI